MLRGKPKCRSTAIGPMSFFLTEEATAEGSTDADTRGSITPEMYKQWSTRLHRRERALPSLLPDWWLPAMRGTGTPSCRNAVMSMRAFGWRLKSDSITVRRLNQEASKMVHPLAGRSMRSGSAAHDHAGTPRVDHRS